jgi:hypothetical protein
VIEPLDAYRFYSQTSRFDDLPSHIASFGGRPATIAFGDLGQSDTGAAADLLADTLAQMEVVMAPGDQA